MSPPSSGRTQATSRSSWSSTLGTRSGSGSTSLSLERLDRGRGFASRTSGRKPRSSRRGRDRSEAIEVPAEVGPGPRHPDRRAMSYDEAPPPRPPGELPERGQRLALAVRAHPSTRRGRERLLSTVIPCSGPTARPRRALSDEPGAVDRPGLRWRADCRRTSRVGGSRSRPSNSRNRCWRPSRTQATEEGPVDPRGPGQPLPTSAVSATANSRMALSMFSTLGMIRGSTHRRKALAEACRVLRPGGRSGPPRA